MGSIKYTIAAEGQSVFPVGYGNRKGLEVSQEWTRLASERKDDSDVLSS